MKSRPVILRAQADRDVDEALAHYLDEAPESVAMGFIDALAAALAHIGRHPDTGSPRHAQALDLPGLRSWPLSRYPFLVFYVPHADHVDVWRVLHGHRDIPASLREPEEAP